MPQRLDDRTRAALESYLSDVKNLPNESAKTHRFAALIGELFPGTPASTDFAAGVEKIVRIDVGKGKPKAGRIDAYYGNAVIEFENSLKVTGKVAEKQLREYVSGVWAQEGNEPRTLIAIASDGVVWRTYRPSLKTGAKTPPTPADVELDLLHELRVTDATLADLWIRLTSLLFRPERTEPSADQFRVDFGTQSPAFRDARAAIETAWREASKDEEPRLAFDTWRKYLTVTYGSSAVADRELFFKHTYLASIARMLAWAFLSKGKATTTLSEVAGDVLSGRYFEQQRLANLVESDFFQWLWRSQAAADILAPVWERVLHQLLTYDLGHLHEDVLKGVYQELVDPKDRHDLGEYYTPDWLCERIVSEVLPDTGCASVLDPTCGSGSFLRAAVKHELRVNGAGEDEARLQAVLDHVIGIDIHPLAVTIAKVTYLLALGDLVKAARRPVQIPVYLADSLFLPAEVRQLQIGVAPGLEIKFGGKGGERKVTVPTDLVRSPELFDGSIDACTRLAVEHAKSAAETRDSLDAYLARALPQLRGRSDYADVLSALWSFTEELADLIRRRKNHIWAFIVRNAYRPAMLRDTFDFIVGNPPWLSYRYIADPDYQAEVKQRALVEYRVAPDEKKLFTQMELATVFLAHSLTTFARDGGRLAFVMPRGVLNADQHANVRLRKYRAPFQLTGYWDLREVKPLFKVPACVLFATRSTDIGKPSDHLPMLGWEGDLPGRDLPWSRAEKNLTASKAVARVIYLGKRTAFSTGPGSLKPTLPSVYAKGFRQGATIVPRSFYFVRSGDVNGEVKPSKTYWIETPTCQHP